MGETVETKSTGAGININGRIMLAVPSTVPSFDGVFG